MRRLQAKSEASVRRRPQMNIVAAEDTVDEQPTTSWRSFCVSVLSEPMKTKRPTYVHNYEQLSQKFICMSGVAYIGLKSLQE